MNSSFTNKTLLLMVFIGFGTAQANSEQNAEKAQEPKLCSALHQAIKEYDADKVKTLVTLLHGTNLEECRNSKHHDPLSAAKDKLQTLILDQELDMETIEKAHQIFRHLQTQKLIVALENWLGKNLPNNKQ